MFRTIMQNLGRAVNTLGHTRGYIAKFEGVAELMRGGASAVGKVGNLLSLNDFRLYFNGQMTNAEVMKTAVSNLPGISTVPFLGDTLAKKLLPYLPDPDGVWNGLVRKAY
jgi:hypothetical protein